MKEREVVKNIYRFEIDIPETVMKTLDAKLGDNILYIEEHGRIYLKKE